jgi:hypothetical protein
MAVPRECSRSRWCDARLVAGFFLPAKLGGAARSGAGEADVIPIARLVCCKEGCAVRAKPVCY